MSVLRILGELKSASVKTDLLAHAADLLLVELREEVQLEDAFSDLRRRHQVDLEQLRLEMAFVHEIAFQCFEEERRRFLHFVVLKEHLGNGIDWSFRVALGVPHSDHLGESDSRLGVAGDHITKDLNKVGSVIHLLAVRNNFVELVCLDESLNDLVRIAAFLERLKRKLWVVLANGVAQLITHSQLVVVNPAFYQRHLALLEHRTTQLKRLLFVEAHLLQQSGEIDQDGLGTATSRGRQLLELVDCVLGAE